MATKTVNRLIDVTNQTLVGKTNDTITILESISSGSLDMGTGNDKLILKGDGNTLSLTGTETVIGSTGDDAITVDSGATKGVIKFVDLGRGDDQLTLSVAATVQVSNVEKIVGSAGVDKVTLMTAAKGVEVKDVEALVLGKGANIVFIDNVATVTGGAGNDTVTIDAPSTATGVINLGAGNDKLQLSDTDSVVTVSGVETVMGGTGNDEVHVKGALKSGFFNLGENAVGGQDKLFLDNGMNNVTVKNVEVVKGGSGADTITFASKVAGSEIDLGGGKDTVVLGNFNNEITVKNVEVVTGGNLSDVVHISGATLGTFNLGKGDDTLVFETSAGDLVTASASGVETVTGGAGDDKIIFTAQIGAGDWANTTIDLGASGGKDQVLLGNFNNTGVTVIHADSIVGGTKDDEVTLGNATTAWTGGVVDLGTGNDTLKFGTLGATVEITSVENVTGATGKADEVTVNGGGTITLMDLGSDAGDKLLLKGTQGLTATLKGVATIDTVTGNGGDDVVTYADNSAKVVDLGDGSDKLVLANGGNELTVMGVENVVGGTGDDKIHLTGQSAYLDLGDGTGDTVILGGSSSDTNIVTLKGVEVISLDGTTAGTTDQSNDRVTFADAVGSSGSHLAIDLGAGDNRVNLSDTGPNFVDVTKVGAVIGGSGDDTVKVTDSVTKLIDLGDGTDSLTLVAAATLTIGSTEAITATASAGGYDVSLKANYDSDTAITFAAAPTAANKLTLLGTVGISNGVTVTGDVNITGSIRDDVIDFTGKGSVDLGGGNDTLYIHGTAVHAISGGTGADVFHFANDVSAVDASHQNTISDFKAGVDVIEIDAVSGMTGLESVVAFTGTSSVAADTVEFVKTASTLSIDTNGDGVADIVATYTGTFDADSDLAWVV